MFMNIIAHQCHLTERQLKLRRVRDLSRSIRDRYRQLAQSCLALSARAVDPYLQFETCGKGLFYNLGTVDRTPK